MHIGTLLITVCASGNITFIWCFELLESNFDITATPLCSTCFNKGGFVVFSFSGSYRVSVETRVKRRLSEEYAESGTRNHEVSSRLKRFP